MNTFSSRVLENGININKNDTMFGFCTLPHPYVYSSSLILPDVLVQKQRRRIRLAAEVLDIRAKFDLRLSWFQKGTTLVLTRLTFKVRKRWMAFNQKEDNTFKLSALHHSCLKIILFMVSENRLLVVLRFDEV